MSRRPRPIDATPDRNFKCRFYSDCLNIWSLADTNSKESPCRGCPFEFDQGGQPADFYRDLSGSLALLLTIVADPKTIKGYSLETLLDKVFDRLTEMIGLIVGRRLDLRPFVESELRRKGGG